ncbi:glycogen-binding domain-containing protein [Kordia jejudonensis]|uniref:glycogen-binding domain-containing protein n=1 Tax=Kordia jejudonensis TaxID=1348245 RepID=UPI00069A1C04|nr:glycogen-binding domain-containing protein [Kordia jejudonensis]
MKNNLQHIVIVLLLFITSTVFAQEEMAKGYHLEGDEVIFTFDKRDYFEVTDDVTQERIPIGNESIIIKNVAVSGQFNNWAKDQWIMKQLDEFRYEFRKKIADFTDEFSWEFKFVINEQFWAEPDTTIQNTVSAKDKYGKDLHVYNLKMYNAFVSEDGNTSFYLKGYQNAEKVILAGSFNKWDEQLFQLKKVDDGWFITLQLRPGVYQYKFIVDGIWITDEANPNKIKNEFNEYNSLVEVKAYYTFKLRGYQDAKKVLLSGTFNDWSEDGFKMFKTDYGWKFTILLPSGKHQYKFIVDNQWILDPSNPVKEYDYKGNVNSVCMVR